MWVSVVFDSGYARTAKQAQAVADGVRVGAGECLP
jgi:hypothetical protein